MRKISLFFIIKWFFFCVLLAFSYWLIQYFLSLGNESVPLEHKELKSSEIGKNSLVVSEKTLVHRIYGPDERILWQLYNAGQWDRVKQVITQWQRKYTQWQVPSELLSLLETHSKKYNKKSALNNPQLLSSQSFKQMGNSEEILKYSLRILAKNCQQLPYIWNQQNIFHSLQTQPERLQLFMQAVQECPQDKIRLALIQVARNQLDAHYFNPLLDATKRLLQSKNAIHQLEVIGYQQNRYFLSKAINNKDSQQVEQLLARIIAQMIKHQDAKLANELGWYYLPQDHLAAIDWFENSLIWSPNKIESSLGLVYALERNNQLTLAVNYAEQYAANKKMKPILGHLLLTVATQLYDQGLYSKSFKQLKKARLYLAHQQTADELQAWLLWKTQQSQEALQIAKRYSKNSEAMRQLVGEIYLQQSWNLLANKDNQQAYGALLSAEAILGKTKESHKLRSWLNYKRAKPSENYTDLYYRKEFLAAYNYKPDASIQKEILPSGDKLKNIDSTFLDLGMLYRSKSGHKGTSRLDIFTAPLFGAGAIFAHIHEFNFYVFRTNLSSGQLGQQDCRQIGTIGLDRSGVSKPCFNAFNNHESNLFSLQFEYHKSGWFSPYLTIGSTPIGGVVSPTIVWTVGFRQQWQQGYWELKGFSSSVRQSILSYTGMSDPYTGIQWGRVMKTGGQLSGLLQWDKNWSLYTNIEGASLYGVNVANNTYFKLGLSGGYDLNLKYFDYFTLGPGVSYEKYAQNLSYFTLGHGGYFSPQSFYKVGAVANFLTEEGKNFIIKGHAGLGFQAYTEKAMPYFPGYRDYQILANNNIYSSNNGSGVAVDAEIKGAWLLMPYLQLSGGLGYRMVGNYRDYYTGMNLRYYFSGRKKTFSRDIPRFMFEQLF